MYNFFNIVVIVTLGVFSYIECKVCQSMDIRNSVTNLSKLRNCTEIAGYLRIVLMEEAKESDFEDYVFPELTHITGYLLLFNIVKLTSVAQLFPNLRVIRGRELFLSAVLVIHQMPDIREVGTEKLMFIGKGLVIFDRVPYLCYVKTIDWKRIGATAVRIYDYNEECQPCPRQCGEYCWNSFKCQETDTDMCHEECLGCKKYNSSRDCLACKNYDDNGQCVSECPATKVIHSSFSKCITEEQCTNNLEGTVQGNWFVFNKTCINDCPQNYYKQVSKDGGTSCLFCGEKCTKYCILKEPLESLSDLEKLEGCTHIEGSLELRYGGGTGHLEEYLTSIKYISDGLVIARSQNIKTLDFLRNLKKIGGKNSDYGYAILMYENQNLQHLWNFSDPNFKLVIKNGTIGFHNNPQLCISEINQLAEAVKINYSDTDVSHNSNGDRASCNIIDMHVKITDITSKNANLSWQTPPCNEICVGYTVFYKLSYTKDDSKFNSKNVCLGDQWNSIFTSNTSLMLKGLAPFTTYTFYIKYYQSSGLLGSETDLAYFTTLPDSPPPPSNLIAVGISPDTIQLQWNKTIGHGILSHYEVKYHAVDNMDIQKLRNYCNNPKTIEGESIDQDSTMFPVYRKSTTKESFNKSCSCKTTKEAFPDVSILCFDITYPSCEQNALSKYGVDQCENIEYKSSNDSLMTITKRSKIASKQKINSERSFISQLIDESKTSFNFVNLTHFTTYVFYFTACNFFNKTNIPYKCSSWEYTVAKTKPKHDADDITDFNITVNKADIKLEWIEPKEPNSRTVAYMIIYTKEDSDFPKPVEECIPKNHNFGTNYWLIRALNPGKYSIKMQSESLAGKGRFSRVLHFEILSTQSENPTLIITCTVTLICITAAIVIIWIWYKKKHELDNLQLIATINPDYDNTSYVVDEWEINRNDIEIQNDLGHGTFGVVFSGRIKSTSLKCAIKTINENRSLHERMEFLNEASVMKTFSNCHHVVKLLGVVSRGDPPLVVMELMGKGDLKKFLHNMRDFPHKLTHKIIFRMACEIADGMAYLAAKKFVHRDLAARNCMVADDGTVKIGDFGMTRDIYETDYYKKESKGLLPVRWMAPESLADGVFTSDSDVWSYGIVLWEIATLAEQPYQGLSNEGVLRFVLSKGSLDRPNDCSDQIYEIMKSCWNWRPTERPTFLSIVRVFEKYVDDDFKLVSYVYSIDEGIDSQTSEVKQNVYSSSSQDMETHKPLLVKYSSCDKKVSIPMESNCPSHL